MPNRQMLELKMAEAFLGEADGAVMVSPAIFTLSAWVESLAVRVRQLRGQAAPASPDRFQLLEAWQTAIRASKPDLSPAALSNVAIQARAADRLLRHWHGGAMGHWLDEDYYGQRARLRAQMRGRDWYAPEDWMEDLCAALEAGDRLPVELPGGIRRCGFIELTPLETRLFTALEKRGVRIEDHQELPAAKDVRVESHERPEDEWRAAALWAESRIREGAKRLGVVIAGETSTSPRVGRRLQGIFAGVSAEAENRLRQEEDGALCYFPVASRLHRTRLVQDALLLLRLTIGGAREKHGFPVISQWLLGRHWAACDSEGTARARLELRLREEGIFSHSLQDVDRFANRHSLQGGLPGLIDRVRRLESLPRSGSHAEIFHRYLQHWGWPGPLLRGEAAARGAVAFIGLLERLSAIPTGTIEGAERLLSSMCRMTELPAGGGPLSPVQILSPEVAAAGRFDGLWLCHFDDGNWPGAVSANPFLPYSARAGIPRMNPEGLLRYTQELTRRLCRAAAEVRISWSRLAEEGPRGPSPLVSEFRPGAPRPKVPVQGLQAPLEALEDDRGLALKLDDGAALPGGSGFFRAQGACPLMAYLEYRLAAKFPAMPGPFADPRYRGLLLHRALFELYAPLAGRRGLPAKRVVAPAVDAALSALRAGSRLSGIGVAAERGRLIEALEEWLGLESQRGGFTVRDVESRRRFAVHGIPVEVRIDRIDRLDDGRLFVIDYKSGRTKALMWTRPRLLEAQLPLYAVLLESEEGDGAAGGIAFATVRQGACGFDGIGDDAATAVKGIRTVGALRAPLPFQDWRALVGHWREQIEALIEEMCHGRADNRLYDPDALAYSDLGLVLRREEGERWLLEQEGRGAG